MKVIKLITSELTETDFILLDSKVIGYYGYNHHQLEYRLLKNNITKSFCIKDIKKNVHIQKVGYFFIKDQIQFIIAIRNDDGIETNLHVYNDKEVYSVKLNRPIKGKVTTIFVKSLKDHSILTVGTLDSALYVARFTDDLKKSLACALARTDARNSLSQEVLELDTPIIMVGGANGVLEFFLCKGALDQEPQLEFVKTEMPSLPSNLPILTLETIKTENDHLITIEQGYQKIPKRPNASQKSSFSVIKFDNEVCKEIVSNSTHLGTTFSALMTDSTPYQLWSCTPENPNAQDFECTIQAWSLHDDTWKFELKSTHFLKQDTIQPLKLHLAGPTSCWALSKDQLVFIDDKSRGQKRRLSTDSSSEQEPASKIQSKSESP